MIERRFGWFAVLVIVFLLVRGRRCRGRGGRRAWPAVRDARLRRVRRQRRRAGPAAPPGCVDDRRAARRRRATEADMIGVYVFAAVLALLPLAVEEADMARPSAGAAAGALTGAGAAGLHPPLRRRCSSEHRVHRRAGGPRRRGAVGPRALPRGRGTRGARMAPQLQRILGQALQRGRLVRRGARVAGPRSAAADAEERERADRHPDAARRGDAHGHAGGRRGRLGACAGTRIQPDRNREGD